MTTRRCMKSNVSHVQLYSLAVSITFAFTLLAESALAQSRVPQFKDFPVAETYIGKNAPLILRGEATMFRSRLREAAKGKPNFAGHYILTAWGCGASCRTGAVINAKTGKVYQWDFSICCWDQVDNNFKPIEFRLNSKLIVFSGARNEGDDDNGTHFYKFENGRFVHLRSILSELGAFREEQRPAVIATIAFKNEPPIQPLIKRSQHSDPGITTHADYYGAIAYSQSRKRFGSAWAFRRKTRRS